MAEVKRCVQCGLLKEEDEFRKYTYSKINDTKGSYRICKSCEAINTAYRRAKQWLDTHSMLTDIANSNKMNSLVNRTEHLYGILESRGLRVPAPIKPADESIDTVDSLLSFYKDDSISKPTVALSVDTPDELIHWLEMDIQEWKDNSISPEYLQETVYESLKAKYRPQIGVNKENYMPLYDDTYKAILNQILKRFDDYEEECSKDDDVQS